MTPSSIVLSTLLSASPPGDGIADASHGGAAVVSASGPPEEAVEEFHRGRSLYANAEYEEALAAFRRADSLHPAADLQYNIALCHMRLENWSEAITGFEIYLRTKKDPPDRADVEARIAEARRHLAKPTAAVTVAPPPREALPAHALQSEPAPPPPDRQRPQDERGGGLLMGGAIMLAGGLAAAIGGGAGFGLAVSRKNDELDAIAEGGNPSEVGWAEAQQLEGEAQRLWMWQWVSVGIGSGIAITGAIMLGVGVKRRNDARRSIAVLPTGRGLAIEGRF